MDAVGANDNYAWAMTATPEELSVKANEIQEAITEIAFRTALVQSMTEEVNFDAQSEGCDLKEALAAQLRALTVLNTAASSLPVVGVALSFMTQGVNGLLNVLDSSEDQLDAVIQALDFAFNSLGLSMKGIQYMPAPLDFTPILKAIDDFQPIVRQVVQCLESNGEAKNEITPEYCDATADLYRILVTDASVNMPLVQDTDDALRRALVGTRAILDASRNSISISNSDLLQSHSIFVVDLLSQYRDVMLDNPALDAKAKTYAQVSLGVIIGVSNALEACIRVASDPAKATVELQEELSEGEGKDDDQ